VGGERLERNTEKLKCVEVVLEADCCVMIGAGVVEDGIDVGSQRLLELHDVFDI
jgi:hypothetical protein